jgi:hypothetical protein
MSYWPGTNIRKSNGNAFDWKGISQITNERKWKDSVKGTQNSTVNVGTEKRQSIIIYSKAK